jgi:hypothetical protein
MPEPAATTPAHADSLADKAKAVIPRPLKDALRPLASRMGLARAAGEADEALAAPQEDPDVLLELSRPSVNPYTVNIRGHERKFFFLCGCWRSGTHWVARVLNLHPEVNIVGEFHFNHMLTALARFTATDGGVGGWYQGHKPYLAEIAAESVQTLIRRSLYGAACKRRTAVWLGDHSPRYLEPALPGAPNVLVVRDGRDVLVSQAFHSLRARRIDWFRPAFRPFAGKYIAEFQANPDAFKGAPRGFLTEEVWVRAQAKDWASQVRHDLAAKARLSAEGTPVHMVRYEDLHRFFEPQRAALYRFLGLDPALAEAPSEETKTLPGFRKETLTSDNRKGIVGDWMNYFDERVRRVFREEAGEMLVELGYEKDSNW